MQKKLSPIVSEFETQEQADSYEHWFKAKVEASMDNNRARLPHDEVMAGARKIIAEAKAKRKLA
ncbi:stability determinant [Hafnia alvei]|uniref:Stability determinant domain-containing protein n=1 Tax=Hafnia alvei TaxID=569 RepID=A0A1C6Z2Q9_HAFAL|nr:stability determinant [Hafnia alvei]NLS54679.1 stability determinant [Hafnia alvei]SCM53497.1 hypothetical protein BN1044_02992 [Hafnia alvei]